MSLVGKAVGVGLVDDGLCGWAGGGLCVWRMNHDDEDDDGCGGWWYACMEDES